MKTLTISLGIVSGQCHNSFQHNLIFNVKLKDNNLKCILKKCVNDLLPSFLLKRNFINFLKILTLNLLFLWKKAPLSTASQRNCWKKNSYLESISITENILLLAMSTVFCALSNQSMNQSAVTHPTWFCRMWHSNNWRPESKIP